MEGSSPTTTTSNITYFTKCWKRPSISPNDDDIATQSNKNYQCLVCNKPSSNSSSSATPHKKCGRCRIVTYCSTSCQRLDYTPGGHKTNCKLISELWKEKTELETKLWGIGDATATAKEEEEEEKEKEDCPIVGQFWFDHPITPTQKLSTSYCVCLLKLVQFLGRDESWRVAKARSDVAIAKEREKRAKMASSSSTTNPFDDDYNESTTENNNDNENDDTTKSYPKQCNNPLALSHALDVSLDLLHLDRTDGRVRLLIPSLYLQLNMYQQAYDYIKFWLLPNTNATVVGMMEQQQQPQQKEEGGEVEKDEEESQEQQLLPMPILQNQDLTETPESWMDVDAVYTGAGMVFELAYLKCIMMLQVRQYEEKTEHAQHKNDSNEEKGDAQKMIENGTESPPLSTSSMPPSSWIKTGSNELERQVRLLLSIVHDLNPNLLPHLGHYDKKLHNNKPAAINTLLNAYPPGFELQYKMGNPGGRSMEEAASIWQRDMILWHYTNADIEEEEDKYDAMVYLSDFCSNLSCNVVDLNVMRIDDDGMGTKRAEAEELAARLQRENPDLSADGIMMHPEMATLMLKHLNNKDVS